MAQLAEQLICNQQVNGSSPLIGFSKREKWTFSSVGESNRLITGRSRVRVPEGPLADRKESGRSYLERKQRRNKEKKMARWLSWLERRPVTAEVVGSIPIRVAHTQRKTECMESRKECEKKKKRKRDLSSAGRASALQAEGHRFEPYRSH